VHTPPSPTNAARAVLARSGPLAFLLGLFLLALLVLSASRLALVLLFLERTRLEPRLAHLFLAGLRIDVLVASYLTAPAALCVLLLPRAWLERGRRPLALYFALGLTLLVSLEAISPDFVAQYDARPNLLFVESLGGSREILGTILDQYGVHVLLVLALGLGTLVLGTRLGLRLLALVPRWPGRVRAAALVPCLALLFLGMRGTLQHRPINAATVAYSSHNLVNQLALNSAYTAGRAWYDMRHERSPAALYGHMPEAEILARVERYAGIPAAGASGSGIPFLHAQRPAQSRSRPRNLVIVLEESLGAEFVGSLGGLPLTPNLDALAREGLWLTSLYCTGTRTVRGIEAVVSGFLPTPASSVVKLNKAQTDFFTLATLLKRHGYATEFVYGGEGHFDNMAAFFLGNGFERALNEDDYEDPAFRGTWGVSDEDLMRKANELFVAHGDEPFFALVLSTTNHSPYEFPDGRIELHDEEKATRNNTVKYADYAIGELFRLAKRERYWQDTVWLVVADHDERTYGPGLIPVDKFHIPGLFLAPGLAPATLDAVASQIDLAPTALSLMGLAGEHPMIGRDLLALAPGDPGRAILQFNDVHGFLVGDRLAVHPGGAAPRCFRVTPGGLELLADDPELLRDGLAHALLPGLLYDQRRYRLPAPEELRTARR
jgi:phosphoglycerol transferase MdoB-like AlkP superfamily enzyme